MRNLSDTLLAAQRGVNLSPLLKITLSDPAEVEDDIVLEGDRIVQIPTGICDPDSQTAEVVLDNSDGYFTGLDLKGWDAVLERGLVTAAGNEYDAIPPQKVLDQQLSSDPDALFCYMSLIGIPNRMAEDRAEMDAPYGNYKHHWSSPKTVKDLYEEIADGQPVEEDLTAKGGVDTGNGYINLYSDDIILAGVRLVIDDRTVNTWSFKLKKTGLPIGSVTFYVYDAEGNYIDSEVLSNASSLTASPVKYPVTWDTPLELDGEYIVLVGFSGGDASNYVSVQMQLPTDSSPYEGNVKADENGVHYTATENIDDPDTEDYERFRGSHTGGTHVTVMTDSGASFKDGSQTKDLTGRTIYNLTDGSSGEITGNTKNTVTVSALAGGSDNQWESGDRYKISGERYEFDCVYWYTYDADGIDAYDHCEAYEVVFDPHGNHTGGTHATIMTDSAASFKTDSLIGQIIYNTTDGSSGTITDNDETTITVASLSGGSDNQWENGDSYEVMDSLIDTYCPADSFVIHEGDSRWERLKWLLSLTYSVHLAKADGKLHIFKPVTGGAEYDAKYSLADGDHRFFSKTNREALVVPNRIVCHSYPNDEEQYSGSATSATSYALMPVTGSPVVMKLNSSAQATSIAEARITQLEIEGQKGSASVPINLGAEPYDYVRVTDSRQGDSRTGNHLRLKWSYSSGRVGQGTAETDWLMQFSFGKFAVKRIWGTRPSLLTRNRTLLGTGVDGAEIRRQDQNNIDENFEYCWDTFDEIIEAFYKLLAVLGLTDDEASVDEQIMDGLLNYYTKGEIDIGYVSNPMSADLDTGGHKIKYGGSMTIDAEEGMLILKGKNGLYLVLDGSGVFIIDSEEINVDKPIDMNSEKITSLATPTSDHDAATKEYVDDSVDGFVSNPLTEDLDTGGYDVKYSGSFSVESTGGMLYLKAQNNLFLVLNGSGAISIDASEVALDRDLDMNSNQIKSITDPTSDQDAATKKYVDDELEDQPACRVYNSSNISIPDSTWMALTFDSERFDNDSMHSTAANTSRLVAKKAGVYSIFGSVKWATSSPANNKLMYIKLNGSTIIAYSLSGYAFGTFHTISTLYKLAENDYVELFVYQASGADLNVEAQGNYSPEFGMAWQSAG